MPIKKVAHRATMVKKGGNKMALKWVPSSFEESDLKKAKKDGFLPEAVPIIFPSDERVPSPPKGYRVMFLAFLLRGLSDKDQADDPRVLSRSFTASLPG
jgi:hypothetical protein